MSNKKQTTAPATDQLDVPNTSEVDRTGKEAINRPRYQEWEVKIMNGKVEKLKISRKKVNISEDEANILNEGISKGGNTYAKMYFLSE